MGWSGVRWSPGSASSSRATKLRAVFSKSSPTHVVKHPPGERIPEVTEPMSRQGMEQVRYFFFLQKPGLCSSNPDQFDRAGEDAKGECGKHAERRRSHPGGGRKDNQPARGVAYRPLAVR